MAMKQGDFAWHDLMTTDVAAAADFYARVIGWTVADSGLPGMTYMICSAGTTRVAGLMPIPEPAQAAGMTPKWMGYVGVDDVDAKAEELKAAGGRRASRTRGYSRRRPVRVRRRPAWRRLLSLPG